MTSQVDPKKVKALLNKSQTELEDPPEDEEEAAGAVDEDGAADEEPDDEEGDEEEHTVESMTDALKPAVATLNEIVDEFRTGTDAQPKAGVETLEETDGIDAETVHEFCDWTEEAGKKDFRALGEALGLEDVDGFVGWCRAVRKMEEDGGGETTGENESESEEEPDGDDQDTEEEEPEAE